MHHKVFATRLLGWFDRHGRHDLPWQEAVTPYGVWISEIMLQQTQVRTVVPYYKQFMQRFPDVHALASAEPDEVLHLWTGLGYYARARNLHSAAKIISTEYQGTFPETLEGLMALPGIGRSTAGAILSLARGLRAPILDGNVKRVLTRFYSIPGWPGRATVQKQLWQLAEELTPKERVSDYTQAIMDLGATLCTRRHPRCNICPLGPGCSARAHGTQHNYPQPRTGRKLPVRSVMFAILENQHNEILLEQRPPSGIWGGLWSFPEHNTGFDIKGWITHDLGLKVNDLGYRPFFRHTFSHFHLDITPVHIKVVSSDHQLREPERYLWFNRKGRQRLGMPKPVNDLIQQL